MDRGRAMDNIQNTNARFIDNYGNSNKTSVRTTNPPGGKSSFSLGWTEPEVQPVNNRNRNFNNNDSNNSNNNYNNNNDNNPVPKDNKSNMNYNQNSNNNSNMNYNQNPNSNNNINYNQNVKK